MICSFSSRSSTPTATGQCPARSPRPVWCGTEHGWLDAKKRRVLREQLTRIRAIAARHRDATNGGAKELHRIAQRLADQWYGENLSLFEPTP